MKIVQAKPLSAFTDNDEYRVRPLDVVPILERLAAHKAETKRRKYRRKLVFSGEPSPASENYELVRMTGETRYVPKGATMPPTPAPGMAFVRVRNSD